MKEYFPHDYGARNDPKLQRLLMVHGPAGKGVYWDLVEMIYEQGGKLMLSQCDCYAFALRTTPECIAAVINEFGLFENDGTFFWSHSINTRMEERKQKSVKAMESANSRWKNANAMRTQCERNANAMLLKKRKEKKRKRNKRNK